MKFNCVVSLFGAACVAIALTLALVDATSLNNDVIFVSGSLDRRVNVFNIDTGAQVASLEETAQPALSFELIGPNLLAVGSTDLRAQGKHIQVFDLSSGQLVRHLVGGHVSQVKFLKLVRHDRVVSAADDGYMCIWDVHSGQRMHLINGQFNRFTGIERVNDELFAAAWNSRQSWLIKLFRIDSAECVRELNGHSGYTGALKTIAARNLLASASNDRTIRLWDLSSGECVRVLVGHGNEVNSLALNEANGQLISGDANGQIKMWNLDNGECVRTILGAHSARLRSLTYVANGAKLVSTSVDNTVKVWQLNDENAPPVTLPVQCYHLRYVSKVLVRI